MINIERSLKRIICTRNGKVKLNINLNTKTIIYTQQLKEHLILKGKIQWTKHEQ